MKASPPIPAPISTPFDILEACFTATLASEVGAGIPLWLLPVKPASFPPVGLEETVGDEKEAVNVDDVVIGCVEKPDVSINALQAAFPAFPMSTSWVAGQFASRQFAARLPIFSCNSGLQPQD